MVRLSWTRSKVALSALGLVAVGITYALSICWRVCDAELQIFQRNHIFKTLNVDARDYTEPASAASYGGKTYRVMHDGKIVVVHKQLINGFQHAYGSALAAFELGDFCSDIGFRVVEYVEAYTTRGGRTYTHLLDTKKDLHNNAYGRAIAAEAHARGLSGKIADEYMRSRILSATLRGEIIGHFMEDRVKRLPDLAVSGCPGLPNPQPEKI